MLLTSARRRRWPRPREPGCRPGAGDLGLGHVTQVVGMQLQGCRIHQHLAHLRQHLRFAQIAERVDCAREFQVPIPGITDLHDARAHQHTGPGALAAAAFAHGLRLGLRVQLIDQRQPFARSDIGHPIQTQRPLAQLSDPGLLTRCQVGAVVAD